MKKLTLLLLAMCFAIVSLGIVGCGGGKPDAASSAKQDTASTAKQETVGDLFAKGKNLQGMSYDFEMTTKEIKMSGKMWLSGKKMKSAMKIDNMTMVTLIDGDNNVAYTYNAAEGMAIKVPIDNNLKTADTPDKFTKNVNAAKLKEIETTTYEGVKCRVVLSEDADSKTQTKMWIREDYGIPMRVEVSGTDGSQMVMAYKNLKVGAQPADVFQLPTGVKIMDMGDMMKNLPKQ